MKDKIIKKQEEVLEYLETLLNLYMDKINPSYIEGWVRRKSELTALKSEKPIDEVKEQIAHHYSEGEVYKRLGGVVLKKDNAFREQLLALIDRFEKAPFSLPSRFADELIDLFQPQSEPRGETAGMFELFRNYMETIAPVRFKQIFESMDEDDGILIEECFHYFARMAMEEYKSTDLRRELIAFMNWWNVQDTGHACITITDLCDYDEYLQSRNETTKKK